MSEKVKIYYAHPIPTYGSDMEKRDIKFIKSFILGAEVINPSDSKIQKQFESWKKKEKTEEDHDMRFFKKLIEQCDGLIFRGNTSGVRYEIAKANEFGIPIMDIEEGLRK